MRRVPFQHIFWRHPLPTSIEQHQPAAQTIWLRLHQPAVGHAAAEGGAPGDSGIFPPRGQRAWGDSGWALGPSGGGEQEEDGEFVQQTWEHEAPMFFLAIAAIIILWLALPRAPRGHR